MPDPARALLPSTAQKSQAPSPSRVQGRLMEWGLS
jgi:hypothetical protein